MECLASIENLSFISMYYFGQAFNGLVSNMDDLFVGLLTCFIGMQTYIGPVFGKSTCRKREGCWE